MLIFSQLRNALKRLKYDVQENKTFINFQQAKNFILVPALGRPEDDVAMPQISKYYPDYANQNRIHKIPMREITWNDDAMNCISWMFAELAILGYKTK